MVGKVRNSLGLALKQMYIRRFSSLVTTFFLCELARWGGYQGQAKSTATPSAKEELTDSDCPRPHLRPEQFAALDFDYIVVGSGAGGLPLATRLTENPSVHVGLIEAGLFHPNDPIVDIPEKAGTAVGNATYDWLFTTVPQVHAAGRIIQEARGKMLGGSTGINLLGWDRASAAEYDAWASFSSRSSADTESLTAWNFEALLPYFKKSESVDLDFFKTFPGVSASDYAAAQQAFKKADDGFEGPIHASYNSIYGDLINPYVKSWNALGVETNPNIYGGNSAGIRNERFALNHGVRSYSASAYYCPAAKRANLHVLTGAQVTKVNFNPRVQNGLLQATGVSFLSIDESGSTGNVTYNGRASRNVILSAGAVQTPQLLELSGIGDKSVLSPLGIDTLIDLPGVGSNLQDHIFVPSQFVALHNITTFDKLRYNQTFLEEQTEIYEHNHTGFLTTTDASLVFLPANATIWPNQAITSLISSLKNALKSNSLKPLQIKQYQTQLSWLETSNVPQTEIIASSSGLVNPANNTNYLGMLAGNLHPLSRGSIHINSREPLAHPTIDPQYLSFDYDLQILRLSLQLTVEAAKQTPVSKLLIEQQLPPPNATAIKDLENYVRKSFETGQHLVGTAAMACRSLGGVVDSSLKVYGTSNVNIVDASIMPLIVGAHLQGTVYAISEKAADIIRFSNDHLLDEC